MKTPLFNARRAWLVIGGLLGLFLVLGIFLDKTHVLVDLYTFGIIALPASAILFTLIYTAFGFMGRAKWWKDEIGITIVMPYVAMVFSNVVLAWAEIFNHGSLTASYQAWLDITGLLAATGLLLWRSVVWIRTGHRFRMEEPGDSVKTEK